MVTEITTMTRTAGASNYFLSIPDLGMDDLPIKSITQVSFEGKGTGAQKAIASGNGGGTFRNTTIGGFETNPTITIEVYLCGESESASYKLYEWFQGCLHPSDGGNGDWENNRFDGEITLYDPQGEPRLAWEMQMAWVSKYSLSDGDVTGDALAVETFEITAEYIEKITGFGDLTNIRSVGGGAETVAAG